MAKKRHISSELLRSTTILFALGTCALSAQQTGTPSHIVQPGAPGQANKTLTPATADGTPRAPSAADIAFMQGMIMHHGQAVRMTAMIPSRSHNPEVLEIGKRISVSQTDEMRFMKQWLTDRGLPLTDGSGMDPNMDMDKPMMPGMLTATQMKTLEASTGPEFDHLFLTGMIQHHTGALIMVKDLFKSAGAGQDPFLFDFASDVDNTQQAEIDIMQHMLKEKQ